MAGTAPDGTEAPGTSAADFEDYAALTAGAPLVVRLAGERRGKGAYATAAIAKGDSIYADEPLCAMQEQDNMAVVEVCHHCMRFVGTLGRQLQRAAGETVSGKEDDDLVLPGIDDAELAAIGPLLPCPGGDAGCQAVFCSGDCMRIACCTYHYGLCQGGPHGLLKAVLASGLPESHTSPHAVPAAADGGGVAQLLKPTKAVSMDGFSAAQVLERHAEATNEAFLLAAKVYGIIMQRWLACRDVDKAVLPFVRFHRQPWWQVVAARYEEASDDDESKSGGHDASDGKATEEGAESDDSDYEPPDVDEEAALREAVEDGLELLRLIYWRDELHKDSGLEQVFSVDFLANVIGTFELNNIAIKISGPVSDYLSVAATLPASGHGGGGPALGPLLQKITARQAVLADGHDEEDHDEAHHGKAAERDLDADMEGGDADVDPLLPDGWPSNWYEATPECYGTALFPILACLNHSCYANCCIKYLRGTRKAVLVAQRDIEEGEELTVSYIDDELTLAEREAQLRYASCQQDRQAS